MVVRITVNERMEKAATSVIKVETKKDDQQRSTGSWLEVDIKAKLGTAPGADGSFIQWSTEAVVWLERLLRRDTMMRKYVDAVLQAKYDHGDNDKTEEDEPSQYLLLVIRCDPIADGPDEYPNRYRPRMRQYSAETVQDDAWLSEDCGSFTKPLFVDSKGKLHASEKTHGRAMNTGGMDCCQLDRSGDLVKNALYISELEQDDLPAEFRMLVSRTILTSAVSTATVN